MKMFGAGELASFKPFKHLVSSNNNCNIPEAFSVKLSIKSITPNAFNTQAAFLTDSLSGSKIIPNITVKETRRNPLETFKNYLSDSTKKLSETAEFKKAEEVLKNQQNQ
jgi:hypothetical protein